MKTCPSGRARAIAGLGWLSLCVGAAVAAAEPADSGRLLFEGGHPALRLTTTQHDPRVFLPPEQAACTSCHRPSGLGSFEGGSAVPPISSGLLAHPYDPATTRRYAPSSQLRVRPPYDAAALHRLLTQGQTPDGRQLGALMPRYSVTPEQSAALLTHLNDLGSGPTPGVDGAEVHFATITTDDLDAGQRQDLLGIMQAFFVQKNASTRSEDRRRVSAERNEQSMYRRYRKWTLHHWNLSGAAETWPAQLAQAYRQQPVFAVLSGAGQRDWTPVHDFCEAERLPCLFPITPLPSRRAGFYATYFSGGLLAQAQWLGSDARARVTPAGDVAWLVLTGEDRESRAQGNVIADTLRQSGQAAATGTRWVDEPVVVTALAASEAAARLPGPGGRAPAQLYLLAGAQAPRPGQPALAPWRAGTDIQWVTQQQPDAAPLARARAWWRGRAYQPHDEAFAAQVLFALVAAVETLVHVDESFSREYCLEKLEHNLENMPPLTAYPRLSLGPAQRLAARQVWTLPDR